MGEQNENISKNQYREGYVSFDIDELKQIADEGTDVNAEAYGYIYEALKNTSDPNIRRRGKKIDDEYPISAWEVEEMRKLLDKAEDVAGDKQNPHFRYCMNEMRSILDWSSERHWNFQWAIILGVILTVIFLSWRVSRHDDDVEKAQEKVTLIKNWTKSDTTVAWDDIARASTDYIIKYHIYYAFNNAQTYKIYMLMNCRYNYDNCIKYAEEYANKADTTSNKEWKKDFQKKSKENYKNAEEFQKEYEDINSMNFKKIQKAALEDAKTSLSRYKGEKRSVLIWNIFFILLIPLYIFAERPYGYSISRHRAEAEKLGGLTMLAYSISGMLIIYSRSIKDAPDIITKYSNGKVVREYDIAGNQMVAARKIILYIIAFALICITSCLIMLYSTIQGLRRNYNWKEIYAKSKEKRQAK